MLQVQDVIDHTVSTHGRVDGVANCVGSVLLRPAHTTSEEDFMECFRINTLSAFNVIKGSVRPQSHGTLCVLCANPLQRLGDTRMSFLII